MTLDDLVAFYSPGYFAGQQSDTGSVHGYKNYLAHEKLLRLNAQKLLGIIASCRPPLAKRSLLDVGCAYGLLLDEARKLGCEVVGLELSEEASNYARSMLGLQIKQGTLQDADFGGTKFDIVTMIGVIEHLQSPREALETLATLLHASGIVVITTIDTKGLFPFFSWKPPEHLAYFNHNNIALLLKDIGFNNIRIRPLLVYYDILDVLYRLACFVGFAPLVKMSVWFSSHVKWLANAPLLIPTNEMLVIGQRI